MVHLLLPHSPSIHFGCTLLLLEDAQKVWTRCRARWKSLLHLVLLLLQLVLLLLHGIRVRSCSSAYHAFQVRFRDRGCMLQKRFPHCVRTATTTTTSSVVYETLRRERYMADSTAGDFTRRFS